MTRIDGCGAFSPPFEEKRSENLLERQAKRLSPSTRNLFPSIIIHLAQAGDASFRI